MSSWDINKQENELKEIQFFMLLLKVCYQRSGSGVCEYEDLGVPAFEASVCSWATFYVCLVLFKVWIVTF